MFRLLLFVCFASASAHQITHHNITSNTTTSTTTTSTILDPNVTPLLDIIGTFQIHLRHELWTSEAQSILKSFLSEVIDRKNESITLSDDGAEITTITFRIKPSHFSRQSAVSIREALTSEFQNMNRFLEQLMVRGFPNVLITVAKMPELDIRSHDNEIGGVIYSMNWFKTTIQDSLREIDSTSTLSRAILIDHITQFEELQRTLTFQKQALEDQILEVNQRLDVELKNKIDFSLSEITRFKLEMENINKSMNEWSQHHNQIGDDIARDYDASMQLIQQVTEILDQGDDSGLVEKSRMFHELASKNGMDTTAELEALTSQSEIKSELSRLSNALFERVKSHEIQGKAVMTAFQALQEKASHHIDQQWKIHDGYEKQRNVTHYQLDTLTSHHNDVVNQINHIQSMHSTLFDGLKTISDIIMQRYQPLSKLLDARNHIKLLANAVEQKIVIT